MSTSPIISGMINRRAKILFDRAGIGIPLVAHLLKLLLSAVTGLALLIFVSSFIVASYRGPIQGEWVDRAVAEILTKRYGDAVTLKNAKIVHWTDICFESLKIYSKENSLLVSAGSGRLRMKRLGFQKGIRFETEIDLAGVSFSKRFYSQRQDMGPWVHLMRRPIEVRDLKIRVIQGGGFTAIHILKCDSGDIGLSGGMVLHRKGVLKDSVRISMSPLKVIRKIL